MYAPTLAPTNHEILTCMCLARAPAHRGAKAYFPSRPRATLCLTVVEPASRALACDLRIFAEVGVYACARARLDQFVCLHHQPASSEHSSKVKFGWYSSHHFRRSLVSSSGPSSMNTTSSNTNTKKPAKKIMN